METFKLESLRKFTLPFLVSLFAVGTVEAFVTDNESESDSVRAFDNYTRWTPQENDPSPIQFYSDRTYLVRSSAGKSIYVDDKCSSMSFAGGTLQFGSSSQYGYLVLCRQMPDVLEVKNGKGLLLAHGGLVCKAGTSGSRFAMDGILTTKASSAARRVVLSLGDNNSTLRVYSKIVSENNNPLFIGGTNKIATAWHTGNRVELAGDCSDFSKEIRLWTKGMDTSELSGSPELTLAVGGTVLPGKVTVSINGALEPLEGEVVVVDSVEFKGNNWLNCSRSADKTVLGKISVTNVLNVSGGPVKVVPARAPLHDGSFVVLEFPSTSDVDADDFVLLEDYRTEFCTLMLKEDRTHKSLILKYEGLPEPIDYVYQTVSLATLGVSESWSDTTSQAGSGKHYALSSEGMTDEYASATICMPDDVFLYKFPGESLMIDSGCSLKFVTETTEDVVFSCKRLDLMDGSEIKGGSQIPIELDGGVINVSGAVQIGTASGRNITIRSRLSGMGRLWLCGYENGSYPNSAYYLDGNNSAFRGTIDMTMLRNVKTTFDENFSRLYVNASNQLGGNLSELNRKALLLNDYALMNITASFMLEESSNRGIMVEKGAQIYVGEDKQGNKRTFTMETPLSLNGELRKIGAGTLFVKGISAGFGKDGLSESPVEGKNIFSVRSGTLAVGSADAINGVAVKFESGTRLELRPNFGDPDFMRYGIRNDKTSVPFSLGEGVSSLPFSIGVANGKPESGVPFRLGLFTVQNEATALDLVRKVVQGISYPVAGFKCKSVLEIIDEELDTVTFALDYTPIGFCLSIR